MADNTWIETDRVKSGFAVNKVFRLKIMLTVVLLLSGTAIAIVVHSVGSNATMYQAEGILIDAGEHQTYWTNINYSENTENPTELLNLACTLNSYEVTISDGQPTSITIEGNTFSNNSERTWGLWFVEKGSFDFKKADNIQLNASNYTVVAWAFMTADSTPSVAVDATGTCIYGYSKPSTVVTLSPTCTELIGSMNASSLIIGTDMSSNYPSIINTNREGKLISTVGTYTDPSYEAIMALNPDMVICDGSQLSHIEMANSLRNSNINAVVIYNGTDFESVLENIEVIGCAMNYNQRAKIVIDEIVAAYSTLETMTKGYPMTDVMITLGSNPSPYVAASHTYINDIAVSMGGDNVFSYLDGWPQVNSENIVNCSCIIVLDEGRYNSSQYDLFLAGLSERWKSTDAYHNGRIYLLCENVSDMAQRYGPRTIQLAEILARILTPEAFDDGITMPLAIGNDYQTYLTITKEMGYDL